MQNTHPLKPSNADLTQALPSMAIKMLGRQDYTDVWQGMKTFSLERRKSTPDEIWLVEHNPVFTQGQAGKPEHILNPGNIPIVKSDRGGQVTYHGPGQIVVYPLLDIKRLKLGVRNLVSALENATIDLMLEYGITSNARGDAPGVYVEGEKIASLGVRISKGHSLHGIAINVDMDLEPFSRINPCGFAQLKMTQMRQLLPSLTENAQEIGKKYTQYLVHRLGLT